MPHVTVTKQAIKIPCFFSTEKKTCLSQQGFWTEHGGDQDPLGWIGEPLHVRFAVPRVFRAGPTDRHKPGCICRRMLRPPERTPRYFFLAAKAVQYPFGSILPATSLQDSGGRKFAQIPQ